MADIERSKEQVAVSKAQALARAGKHADAANAYGAALGDWNNPMVYRNRGGPTGDPASPRSPSRTGSTSPSSRSRGR